MLPNFNESFWASFWPGLFSSLFVAFFITFAIAWIIKQYRRPKLDVQVSIGHTAKQDKFLIFKLINIGRTGLMPQEAHWFFYFELLSERDRVFVTDEKLAMIILNNGAFYEASGFNEVPCHPGSSIDLIAIPVKPSVNFPYRSLDDVKFYCSITTNKGTWHPSFPLFSFNRKKVKYDDGHVVRHVYKINKVII
jgi:hypothetical protein